MGRRVKDNENLTLNPKLENLMCEWDREPGTMRMGERAKDWGDWPA